MSDDRRLGPLPVLALVCAGATAATIAARSTKSASLPTAVATNPRVSVSLPAASTAAPVTTAGPQPTLTTGTLPTAPGPPSTATLTTAPPTTEPVASPHAPLLGSWPRRHAGYTVILQSLPESSGREAAVARARVARAAGIADVGVLLSSDFSTLRGGYWVVFAGDFGSSGAAEAAAAGDRARGFGGAYPARISP
jgi:hypothetical protein